MTEKDKPDYDTAELNEVLGKPPLLNGEDREKSKKASNHRPGSASS